MFIGKQKLSLFGRNRDTRTIKQKVNDLLNRLPFYLPEDCTLEDIQYHRVLQKIGHGLKDEEKRKFPTQSSLKHVYFLCHFSHIHPLHRCILLLLPISKITLSISMIALQNNFFIASD